VIYCDGLGTSERGIADVDNAEALLTEMTVLFYRLEFELCEGGIVGRADGRGNCDGSRSLPPEIGKLFPSK